MKKKNNILMSQNDKIWKKIKKSIFYKELYNKKSITFKIVASSIFLSMTIGLSTFEIFNILTYWGIKFGLRFFDTLIIIYSISIVGLLFALLEGISLPLIHNLIDSHHTIIETIFFIISNILIIFITWFIYYILFNAYHKIIIPENIKDHTIHEYHYFKNKHDHHHKIINIKLKRKILASVIIIPICALIETISLLIVIKILVNIDNTNCYIINNNIYSNFNILIQNKNIKNNFINLSNKIIETYNNIFNYIQYRCNYNKNIVNIFNSWFSILIFIKIFFVIFIIKYIINTFLFLLLEQKTRQLIDRYGIYS